MTFHNSQSIRFIHGARVKGEEGREGGTGGEEGKGGDDGEDAGGVEEEKPHADDVQLYERQKRRREKNNS